MEFTGGEDGRRKKTLRDSERRAFFLKNGLVAKSLLFSCFSLAEVHSECPSCGKERSVQQRIHIFLFFIQEGNEKRAFSSLSLSLQENDFSSVAFHESAFKRQNAHFFFDATPTDPTHNSVGRLLWA